MNDSRDFTDAESARSGLSHVPSQPALFPPYRDPCGLLSRSDKPPDIWNSHGISGNVFANPPASSSSPYPGDSILGFLMLRKTRLYHKYGATRYTGERQIPDTVLLRHFSRDRQPEIHSTLKREDFQRIMGRPTTADFGSSFWQIPWPSNTCLLEDKIQNCGLYLFTITYGSCAMDQRSGDGWFSGWSEIFAFCQRNSWSRLWGTRRENCFSTDLDHPEYPLQEKGQSGGN